MQILSMCALLLLALGAGRATAAPILPGPTAQLFVLQARLKLVVTMTSDAAKDFLANANLPSDVAQSLTPTLPLLPCDLPEQIAPRLFEISANGNPLTAEKVSISTEDTNVLFTLIYLRPENGFLNAKAVFPTSNFVARDENQELLNVAQLSRGNNSVRIQLPAIDSTTPKWTLPEEPTDEVGDDEIEAPVIVTAPAAVPPQPAPSAGQFVRLGLQKLLMGLEHLLFLGLLLIGTRRILPMLGVIACFTVAESITLSLSAMGTWSMPANWIEPLVILSIIAAAADNLWRRDALADRFWLAAGFGFIHGFDFARAFHETALGSPITVPLVSFNIGLALGQIAVAAIVVPIFLILRRTPAIAKLSASALWAAGIAAGSLWLIGQMLFFR